MEVGGSPSSADAGDEMDLSRLRERYAVERDRRLRSAADRPYVSIRGSLTHYLDDPYAPEIRPRERRQDEIEVVIIGGGIGGLVTAAALRDEGVEDITVIDKAGDFGGTWYWNRYPGIQCDLESYIYMPLLEKLNYIPSAKYAPGAEILAHLQRIAQFYKLYDTACLQTGVTGIEWDEADHRWIVSTDREDRIRARYVVMPSGIFTRPKLPGILGIERFAGHSFHASRWDYEYTGGDASGNLTGLAGKRVAVIGTGATAIQCVPHVAATSEHLYVFQRTPSAVAERGNLPTDPAWAASLEPGWQDRRMTNFNILVTGGQQDVDLVNDAWTDLFANLTGIVGEKSLGDDGTDQSEVADLERMERIRRRIEQVVRDPRTAESLKPYFRMFCKRPTFSDDYLPTFNRPNVTLVDTLGRGVESYTEQGVVVGDHEYQVDCIIYASGFETNSAFTERAGFDVIGRMSQKLSEKWSHGPRTYLGLHSHGFPNMFFLGAIQTGLTSNFTHTLKEQARHIAFVVSHCAAVGATVVDATKEAEGRWVDEIRSRSTGLRNFLAKCTPGYFNSEGMAQDPNSILAGQYFAGPEAFFRLLADWRKTGSFEGVEIS